jgi:flavin reductase (DIM6/NTAB) family NADH-FMN oxidoreductase RutF/DNA-binding transcriptional LysR family regulator
MNAMTADLRATFIEGMSRVASAVTVVTTDGDAGRYGVTVSSMTSVSADTARPSLLISVHHLSPACEAIKRNRRFCANVLSGNQSFVSDLFSGRLKHLNEDRFGAVAWHTGATGAPIIDNAVVSFDCELKTALMWGTHFLFVGEAEHIEFSAQRSPLVYANRGYRRAIPISPDPNAGTDQEHRLSVGFFITLGPQFLPAIVADFARRDPAIDMRLLEADHDDLVEQMRARRIDAAITVGKVDDGELVSEIIAGPEPHVLLPAAHPLAARRTLLMADLAGQQMILLDHPSVRSAIDALFMRNGMKPDIRFQSPAFAMVRGLVGQGLGYTLLPQAPFDRASLEAHSIAAVPLEADFPEGAIVAIRHKADRGRDLPAEFVEKCRASFRTRSDSGEPQQQQGRITGRK